MAVEPKVGTDTTSLEREDVEADETANNAESNSDIRSTPLRTDEEFQAWLLDAMISLAPQLHERYPKLFRDCTIAVTKWRIRFRGNPQCWLRLFKQDRIIKEVVESIPVIDAVQNWLERNDSEDMKDLSDDTKITIIDLCSGKGFLSMLLSELLPPEKFHKCLLIDKAWPLCHSKPRPHHMSWEHIYGNLEVEDSPRYFTTWPISLVTSKQDLKQSRDIRYLQKRFADHKCPILILAVHLCGTLSIQAVKLFQLIPSARMLLLKPCCLPGIWHARNYDSFMIGDYCFPTKEVCAKGKWTTNKEKGGWEGPPRWHLRGKFTRWCHHLHEAMARIPVEESEDPTISQGEDEFIIETREFSAPIQTKGGFQNTFLLAERRLARATTIEEDETRET